MRKKVLAVGTALLAFTSQIPSQDPTAMELAAKVTALRDATTTKQRLAAWLELEKFVPTATSVPSAARTDALAAGLDVDFGTQFMKIRVIDHLVKAPDRKRVAHHLLRLCVTQDELEKDLASKLNGDEFDPEEAAIFGRQMDPVVAEARKTLEKAIGLETVTLRGAIIKACIAVPEPDAIRGMVILTRRLTRDPVVDPMVEVFLAHKGLPSVDGLLAVFEKAAARRTELAQAVQAAERRKARPTPRGERKSTWTKKERSITHRLVALRKRRLADHDARFAALVKRVKSFASTHDLPNPPRKASPLAPWKSWRKRVATALDGAR